MAQRLAFQDVAQAHARYYEQTRRGHTFMANAQVTAPVIWSTEVGTGGPLLWNGAKDVELVILAVGFGYSVVSTVAGSLGLTGGYGQYDAPTTTTVIDTQGSMFVDDSVPQATAYRIGTTGANRWFFPFATVGTGAITTDQPQVDWVDFGGMIVVPPNSFLSVAASATLTELVAEISLIWEEVPI